MAIRIEGARRPGATGGSGAITHGFQVTASNTGIESYFDNGLGRYLTLSDLTVQPYLYVSDLVAAGGTLYKQNFAGGVKLDVPCTLVACRFDGDVTVLNAGTNFNNCTMETSGAAGNFGLGYGGFTATRCRIGGGSDGVKAGSGATTLTECYIRTMSQSAADHNDGMQDSSGTAAVTIQRCNIDARPVNGGGGPNAALFAADACAGPHSWYDNFVAGGGYVLRMHENAHYDVQGNWVLDGSWGYGPTSYTNTPLSYITWGTSRANVIVDASGNTLSTLTLV